LDTNEFEEGADLEAMVRFCKDSMAQILVIMVEEFIDNENAPSFVFFRDDATKFFSYIVVAY
jgi:hypothetical protein